MQCILDLQDKTYLIRNGQWQEVSKGSQLSDYPEPIVVRESVVPVSTRHYKVPSSKPGKFYTVTQTKTHFSCDCQGYLYRAKCRHIVEAKQLT